MDNNKFAIHGENHKENYMASPMSGELIRMQNYVDDIATTLRRISANVPSITDEERKKLAEYMKKSDPSFMGIMEKLEKGA